MEDNEIVMLGYVDEAALVEEVEDDLQRLLYLFNNTAKALNMVYIY